MSVALNAGSTPREVRATAEGAVHRLRRGRQGRAALTLVAVAIVCGCTVWWVLPRTRSAIGVAGWAFVRLGPQPAVWFLERVEAANEGEPLALRAHYRECGYLLCEWSRGGTISLAQIEDAVERYVEAAFSQANMRHETVAAYLAGSVSCTRGDYLGGVERIEKLAPRSFRRDPEWSSCSAYVVEWLYQGGDDAGAMAEFAWFVEAYGGGASPSAARRAALAYWDAADAAGERGAAEQELRHLSTRWAGSPLGAAAAALLADPEAARWEVRRL